MAVEVPQNEEISGGGKNIKGKRSRFCYLSKKEQIWEAQPLMKESK